MTGRVNVKGTGKSVRWLIARNTDCWGNKVVMANGGCVVAAILLPVANGTGLRAITRREWRGGNLVLLLQEMQVLDMRSIGLVLYASRRKQVRKCSR